MSLPPFLVLFCGTCLGAACQQSVSTVVYRTDTGYRAYARHIRLEDRSLHPPSTTYEDLEYQNVEVINAASGTKSVIFNTTGTKLYAMNLEGMSIYEYDQPTRRLMREFRFKPTKGTGWDYVKDKPIPSFQEKPVEACFSHEDKFLWVSLHNAEGIVPIRLDSVEANRKYPGKHHFRSMAVSYPGKAHKDTVFVPLIKTGKTPKVISRTADSRHLVVSNWHSYNVSVLETHEMQYPYATEIAEVPVASIPRGIAVDDRNNRSYIAIMGGASITVVNNSGWMKVDELPVASNPRHIVTDSSGRLFVSYNKLGKIACIDGLSGKTLFTASTHAQPRTIMLSKNQRFLFVTCYSSDYVDVFKINDTGFEKRISLPCKGHPVGVDIFEDEENLEAWVCSYTTGKISIFNFRKK